MIRCVGGVVEVEKRQAPWLLLVNLMRAAVEGLESKEEAGTMKRYAAKEAESGGVGVFEISERDLVWSKKE